MTHFHINFKSTKALFLFFLVLITSQVSAQFCTDDARFSEIEIFSNNDIEILTDVTYGNAISWNGNSEDLKMDFFFPSMAIDPMPSRPFILLIHGGGFTVGDKTSYYFECRELAKRGYVVATINYRLGYDQSDPLNIVNAVYRAQQDANAALRYTIEIASSIEVETSSMFIGGASAGSITSLFTTYMDQDEWNSTYPGIESILGSIDTSGNDLTHNFEITGVLNQWGAGPDEAMTPDGLKPMISFHGALDDIIPIGDAGNGTIGSQYLHYRLIDNEVCSDFTLDPLGNHVVYETLEGREFMVNRTSCFFKSLFCNNCVWFFSNEMVAADCSGILANNDLSTLNEIAVFPNPFKDQLNFNNLNGNEYFYLYTIHGGLMYEGYDIQSQNFHLLSIGMYLLVVQNDENKQIFKLFKG